MEDFASGRGNTEPLSLGDRQFIRQEQDHAMFLLDRHGRIASWNEGVRAILGYEQDDWIGRPLRDIFTPGDQSAGVPEAELRQALETGKAGDDRWLQRRSGERFLAAGTLTRLPDDAGAHLGFLKVVRDYTEPLRSIEERSRLLESERHARAEVERQRTALGVVERVLQERDEQLRAVFSGVRDCAIFTVGVDGKITSWHEGAALMEGYTADEAIGMPFANLFVQTDRDAGRPDQEMDIAARTGEYRGEGLRQRANGALFDAAVVLTALRGPDGELLGFLELAQDITDRLRQQRERAELLRRDEAARLEAERASHSMGEFLATISHELRTPLGAILGWAQVLDLQPPDAATIGRGLAAITRNARLQVQLIEDLLDMNRIESGQLRLDVQSVEVAGVVTKAVDAALHAARAKGVELKTALGTHPAIVSADADRLQQIVWNLVTNAVKFTPRGGKVTLTVAGRGDEVDIAVADTGQGIAPEFGAHMFDRFQQEDGSTTRRHGGLGIGLSIARQLTELHGGRLKGESVGPGRGATFTLTLPLLSSAASVDPFDHGPDRGPAESLRLPGQPDRLEGITVLLIDDDDDSRDIAGYALQRAGAEVVVATTALDGLKLLRERHPTVVVCDIGMPEHDGYDFVRWMRALAPEDGGLTPAAAFTAFAQAADQVRAIKAGYHMHLSKPAEPRDLIDAVASLAKNRR